MTDTRRDMSIDLTAYDANKLLEYARLAVRHWLKASSREKSAYMSAYLTKLADEAEGVVHRLEDQLKLEGLS